MRTLFILTGLMLTTLLSAQFRLLDKKKIPGILVDSIVNNRTVSVKTTASFDRPVTYSVQMRADSVDGYPRFTWEIVASNNNKVWYPLKSGTVDYSTWDGDSWDTLIIETTPQPVLMLGVIIETIDSTQAIGQRTDLNIVDGF